MFPLIGLLPIKIASKWAGFSTLKPMKKQIALFMLRCWLWLMRPVCPSCSCVTRGFFCLISDHCGSFTGKYFSSDVVKADWNRLGSTKIINKNASLFLPQTTNSTQNNFYFNFILSFLYQLLIFPAGRAYCLVTIVLSF